MYPQTLTADPGPCPKMLNGELPDRQSTCTSKYQIRFRTSGSSKASGMKPQLRLLKTDQREAFLCSHSAHTL
jgi:hypothetical protein